MNDTNKTPDAVREAATQRLQQFADGAELLQIYGPEWCGFPTIELRRDLSAILAALDSRAGDAGEDIVELRAFLATYQDESDGDLVNRNPCDPLLTWGILRRIATPAPAVDAVPAGEGERTLAAGRIIDIMTGGKFDWRSRLEDSDFLESADWLTALAYADAALSHGEGRK